VRQAGIRIAARRAVPARRENIMIVGLQIENAEGRAEVPHPPRGS